MLDLNDTAPAGPRLNLTEISHRLAETAAQWVPRLFPRGVNSGSELRVANIRGDAPRKNGSCVVSLEDGSYWDFDPAVSDGGDALQTIRDHFGIDFAGAMTKAAELIGVSPAISSGGNFRKVTSHRTNGIVADQTSEINWILSRAAAPTQESRLGLYLASRGLDVPDSPDLLFHGDLLDWQAKVGRPAMVAVVRNAAGERIGIHRTYLAYDGSGKADMPSPRKMLGSIDGGAVRLFQPDGAGTIGLAEGIETALAAQKLFGVPCWAALSAGNMAAFVPPPGVRHVVIYADAGRAGEEAASRLSERLLQHNVSRETVVPQGGDDFNDDLMRGHLAARDGGPIGVSSGVTVTATTFVPDPPLSVLPMVLAGETQASRQPGTEQEVIEPTAPDALATTLGALSKFSPAEDVNRVIAMAAAARMDGVAEAAFVRSMQQRTGIGAKAIKEGLAALRRKAPSDTAPAWIADCLLTAEGEPKALLHNCALALEQAPEWQGVIGFDAFAQRPVMRQPAPWIRRNGHWDPRAWSDGDDYEATRWLQKAGIHAGSLLVHEAVMATALKNPFHPVQDYLGGLAWDGVPRLDRWVIDFLGAADTPYARAVGARWMISGAARILRPGCKADCVLVLEQRQGARKSTALRILGDPWFTDDLADFGSADCAMQLAGMWIVELSELDVMKRAEIRRVKAFLSRTTDRYRPPYGRHVIEQPRSTVFAGSVNEDTYLDDPTGERRFWPLKCGVIDAEGLWRARDQLWAEAVARYRAGERWYLVEAELVHAAEQEQAARQIEDAWEPNIERFLADLPWASDGTVSTAEVLAGIGIPIERRSKSEQIRVGAYLKKHGWIRYREPGRQRPGEPPKGYRYRQPERTAGD